MRDGAESPGSISALPRILEACLLFGVMPVMYMKGLLPIPVVPLLMLMGVLCCGILAFDRSFDWRVFRRGKGRLLPPWWMPVAVAVFFLGVVLFFRPHLLFYFPREKPLLWGAVMILYPVLSALPQEIMYRVFFLHRYKGFLPGRMLLPLASAVIFGLHHLVMGNWVAVVLSTIGGLRFVQAYRQSGSVWAPAIEHGIYGCIIFTIGLGDYFYHGTIEFVAGGS